MSSVELPGAHDQHLHQLGACVASDAWPRNKLMQHRDRDVVHDLSDVAEQVVLNWVSYSLWLRGHRGEAAPSRAGAVTSASRTFRLTSFLGDRAVSPGICQRSPAGSVPADRALPPVAAPRHRLRQVLRGKAGVDAMKLPDGDQVRDALAIGCAGASCGVVASELVVPADTRHMPSVAA
jgi:hypothetical protein